MKKLIVFSLIIFILLIEVVYAEVRINEVELNPSGKDNGNEWIELYSDEEIDLNGWSIVNNDGGIVELSESFEGYFVIDFEKQWLDNSDEGVVLVDSDGEKVFEVGVLEDSDNDDGTWFYCDSGEWFFGDSSKGVKNDCVDNEDYFEESEEEIKLEEIEEIVEDVEENYDFVLEKSLNNEVINLDSKIYNEETEDIKISENIVYESGNELVKQYAVYGFALLCAILCILFAWRRLD